MTAIAVFTLTLVILLKDIWKILLNFIFIVGTLWIIEVTSAEKPLTGLATQLDALINFALKIGA